MPLQLKTELAATILDRVEQMLAAGVRDVTDGP